MNTVVGVAWGGFTSEHDISKKSGATVFNALQNSTHEVFYIHITKTDWSVSDAAENKYDMDKADFSFTKKDQKIRQIPSPPTEEMEVIFQQISE